MQKPEWLARQSSHPHGLLGHLVAAVMALDTASANRRVVDALASEPGDRILEVGCGHGRTLRRLAAHMGHGQVVGIDPSQVMCSVAARRNRAAIRANRVVVVRADAEDIPAPVAFFDRAFSIHSIYFWRDLEAGLREIRRVLVPGGRLILAFHTSEEPAITRSLPESVYTLRTEQEVAQALALSGFHDTRIHIDSRSRLRHAIAKA